MALVPQNQGKLSLTVERWDACQIEQFSRIHRISGFPWLLRLRKGENGRRHLDVICKMSTKAALWQCNAYIKAWSGDDSNNFGWSHRFNSWEKNNHTRCIMTGSFKEGTVLNVLIETRETGEKWNHYSIPEPREPHGDIQIGVAKTKIHVNKVTLASQSPLFDELFYGDQEEKESAKRLLLTDVHPEEFSNMYKIVNGSDVASLTDVTVRRELELAGRFELKIVQDRAVSFLLSEASGFSLTHKLLISDEFKIPFLMNSLIRAATIADLKELTKSTLLVQLSQRTLATILIKCGKHL